MPGNDDQARIDDLSQLGQIAGVFERLIQSLEQERQSASGDHGFAEIPWRVRIRYGIGNRQTAKSHPRQTIANQMLCLLEAQTMLCLASYQRSPIGNATRTSPKTFGKMLYRGRARVKQAVGKLKCFAPRCEKTKRNFGSFVAIAAAFILAKSVHTT